MNQSWHWEIRRGKIEITCVSSRAFSKLLFSWLSPSVCLISSCDIQLTSYYNSTLYIIPIKDDLLSCHFGWMNRRRFSLQKGGSQEHISLITIMFCFNEFAFTVHVKHRRNSIQILGFILICLYFTTVHFHTCVLCKEYSLFPFSFLAQFSATVSSFMGIM